MKLADPVPMSEEVIPLLETNSDSIKQKMTKGSSQCILLNNKIIVKQPNMFLNNQSPREILSPKISKQYFPLSTKITKSKAMSNILALNRPPYIDCLINSKENINTSNIYMHCCNMGHSG